jgi:single-strand DNA-binding protein
MASLNKVLLIGNLTRDPQLTYTPSQTAICEFGMAINDRWTTKDGEKGEKTHYVDCVIFGKGAENFNKYVTKGNSVLVEGKLDFSQWEQDGQKRSKLKVNVSNFQFLTAPKEANPTKEEYNQSLPDKPNEDIPF